jgi:hypothetical protein
MLHIARVTDSQKTFKKDNLTILNLPNLVADPLLKQELTALVDEVKKKTEFCRDWRHRRFAHHDLLLAVQDQQTVPLKVASKESVNAALSAIVDVMNAVERHYYKGPCDFAAIAAHTGVMTLLFTLGFGVKAREEMEAKIASGKFDDLGTPEQI